jgi:predicted nucleic acid-binding protein
LVSAARAPVGVIDTSVLVAVEKGRPLREEALPARSAISIVTVAELRAGVLVVTQDADFDALNGVAGLTVISV